MIHPPTHLHYFSVRAISRLLDKNGFDLLMSAIRPIKDAWRDGLLGPRTPNEQTSRYANSLRATAVARCGPHSESIRHHIRRGTAVLIAHPHDRTSLYGALSEVDWRSRCTYLRIHWGWDPASQGLLSNVMTNCCSISVEHLVAWRKDVDFA